MARLLFFILLTAAIIGLVAILLAVWNAATAATAERARLRSGYDRNGLMAPTGFQKVAFVALIVLLLGVSSGVMGGL
jgi:hypothetical protein